MFGGTGSGGFSFGAPTTNTGAAPATGTGNVPSIFGTGSGGTNIFGTGSGFGSSATATTPNLFGQQSTQQTQQPAAATGGFSFGQPLTAPAPAATGFSFGAPTATVAPQPQANLGSSFNFPTQNTAPSASSTAPTPSISTGVGGGFGFGTGTAISNPAPLGTAPAAAPTTGFSFGAPSAATTQPSLPSFGAATAPATSSTATPGFSFGSLSTPAAPAASGIGLGLGGSGDASKKQALTFGTSTPATTTTPSISAPLFSSSLSGITSGTGLSFGTPASTATTAPASTTGLGGVSGIIGTTSASALTSGAAPSSSSSFGSHAPNALEQPLPQELLQIIEELKGHTKSEKQKLGELSKSTIEKSLEKVSEEIEATRATIHAVQNQIHRNFLQAEQTKASLAQEIKNLEMANYTRGLPIILQPEFNQPLEYFSRLIDGFEIRMAVLQREIGKADESLSLDKGVKGLSPKDLLATLQASRATLITLAAGIQVTHEQLEREVEGHRELQKLIVGSEKELFTK